MKAKEIFLHIKERLSRLSFKTGMIVLALCAVCYVISFAQALLPVSLWWKGTLWIVFFGLAKTLQYTGLLIIGKEGIKKLRSFWKRKSVEV